MGDAIRPQAPGRHRVTQTRIPEAEAEQSELVFFPRPSGQQGLGHIRFPEYSLQTLCIGGVQRAHVVDTR